VDVLKIQLITYLEIVSKIHCEIPVIDHTIKCVLNASGYNRRNHADQCTESANAQPTPLIAAAGGTFDIALVTPPGKELQQYQGG